MEHNYAHAAIRLVERGMKPAEAAKAISAHAGARGQARIVPRIVRALRAISLAERARRSIVLSVARKEDAAQAHKTSDAPKEVSVQVDDTLIGGWRLRGAGRLVDASYKRALFDLYTRITE